MAKIVQTQTNAEFHSLSQLCCLSDKNAGAASSLNLLLCLFGEELGLHNDWHRRQLAFAHQLEVTVLSNVYHRRSASFRRLSGFVNTFARNVPQLFQVEGRAVRSVSQQVEMAHAHLN